MRAEADWVPKSKVPGAFETPGVEFVCLMVVDCSLQAAVVLADQQASSGQLHVRIQGGLYYRSLYSIPSKTVGDALRNSGGYDSIRLSRRCIVACCLVVAWVEVGSLLGSNIPWDQLSTQKSEWYDSVTKVFSFWKEIKIRDSESIETTWQEEIELQAQKIGLERGEKIVATSVGDFGDIIHGSKLVRSSLWKK
ncbi:hypothetical protein QAD02_019174 [Eretmocerus hayati]|uniref:Uncharacterized protein n=1 Tax=Eretmocerus hayati TaxID=131215 RepID=A0ACC2PLX7_9HYME|nr:hypothetical protein QAD02_019174 [Eretmocerus hayati]